jgi:predicted exporter
MSQKLGATQSFPLFWWNFLVLDNASESPEKVRALCIALRDAPNSPLSKIPCGSNLGSFLPMLRDWARDYSLRVPVPARSEITARFQETYSQATLPLGKEILGVLREDPLGTYRDLRLALESQVMMDLPREGGVFIDRETKRVVLPLQFMSVPSDTAPTERFYKILSEACTRIECPSFTLVGPHASTFTNERQVMSDLRRVSILGLLFTLAQVAYLIFSKRARALWLFPPVLLAIAASTALTVLIFGSIHGLTLSFGTGLIGLALDYGLHSAFNMEKRGVWRANLCGIVTSLCGFGVLYFSEIPLIRQLMTFALIGVIVAGLIFYLLHNWRGEYFSLRPMNYEPRITRPKRFLFSLFSQPPSRPRYSFARTSA